MSLCPECSTELDDDELLCKTARCVGTLHRAELAVSIERPGRRRFRAEDIIASFARLKSHRQQPEGS